MIQARTEGEWKRGWHLVVLTAIGLTCAPTTLPVYTMGVFVTPLEDSFGWSRGAIQAAILFSTGLGLAGGPIAGWLVQRFGLRPAILSGLAGITIGVGLCAALTGAIWQLYAAYALMALLGAGASAVSWSCLIAERFTASRGLALGLALSGTGLSAVIMPRIAAASLESWGWRGGYLALAAFALFVVLPACVLFLPHLKRPSAAVDAEQPGGPPGLTLEVALRHRRFWLIGLSTACVYLAVGGTIPNLVPALTDRGVPADDAVFIMTVLGLSIVAGRIAVGALLDRVWAPAVAALVLFPAAGACLVLTADTSLATYAIAAALLGIATGMEFDMLGFLVGRYFGLADFARIYGRLYMFVAAAAGTAPFAFGMIYDATGSYELPLTFSSVILVGGAAGLMALGRYPALLPSACPAKAEVEAC